MNWQNALIATHLIPYILIPLVMFAFHKRRDYLVSLGAKPVYLQTGFVLLIVSMFFEFLWHQLIQNWEYANDQHIFNGLMYMFMVLGFLFLSLGFQQKKVRDWIAIVLTLSVPIFYAIGFKPIIWIVQTWLLVEITIRSLSTLRDRRVLLFPFFSFVVNMIFISLLFTYDLPIYHILHDILGTLLGFAIFGYVVWVNPTFREKLAMG